jgi:hypothetical protein
LKVNSAADPPPQRLCLRLSPGSSGARVALAPPPLPRQGTKQCYIGARASGVVNPRGPKPATPRGARPATSGELCPLSQCIMAPLPLLQPPGNQVTPRQARSK